MHHEYSQHGHEHYMPYFFEHPFQTMVFGLVAVAAICVIIKTLSSNNNKN